MAVDNGTRPYLSVQKDGAVGLAIYVQPKASKTGFVGMHDGCLKLAIASPPVDNKANKAVVSFLAGFFKVPQKDVKLCCGEKSRRKQLSITGITMDELRRRLDSIMPQCRK
jgi:uncharacterized protein (TIGR00251 family)